MATYTANPEVEDSPQIEDSPRAKTLIGAINELTDIADTILNLVKLHPEIQRAVEAKEKAEDAAAENKPARRTQRRKPEKQDAPDATGAES